MRNHRRNSLFSGITVLLLVSLACSGADSDALLGPETVGATSFAELQR